jgi:hypothetical protein
VAGLVGRWLTLGRAAASTSIGDVHVLLGLSARFERIVIPTSALILVLGIATAIAQGRPFLGPLQGAPVDWLFVALLIYLSALPLVPLVFLPRGRIFEAALAEATAAGEVTANLRAAFRDRGVLFGHLYEFAVTFTVLVLMIWKPF